ncbi:MAG TPA: CHASE2 domain-containing protein [Thioploca sp.]|nr:CHASE2 domain-containing protein [Thioploca sp.]
MRSLRLTVRRFFQGLEHRLFLCCPRLVKRWQSLPRFFRKLTTNLIIGLSITGLLLTFRHYPWLMDTEDASMDWMMQIRQQIIPPMQEKNVPPFVLLDIDEQTHQAWGEPLFTLRNHLTHLIEAAVKAKARLIVVNIDVSQATPVETSSLHPDDHVLKTYLANYASQCKTHPDKSACPPIILLRAFRALPNLVQCHALVFGNTWWRKLRLMYSGHRRDFIDLMIIW